MVKPNQTAYLIIGTSRGIGKGLVKELLIRPDTLVVATIRNAKSSEAKELANLPVGNGSQLYIIEIEVSEPDSIRKAIATLNIDKLDVVISNAAICRVQKSVANVSVKDMLEHYKINVIGSLVLYQATKNQLEKSSNPKFVFMSSVAGSIDIQANFPFNNTPYSISKAAVNAIGTRLAVEEKGKMIVLLFHPGIVDTDMVTSSKSEGLDVAKSVKDMGLEMITTQQTAQYLLKYTDAATHEESGKLVDVVSDEKIPW